LLEAIRIYSTAKGYAQSAYLIVTSPHRYQVPDDTTFILPYHMLLGFAVELYLKAYSTYTGHPDSELRGADMRHNLGKLLELNENDGFNLPAAKKLADYLGEQHRTFEYRYMKPDSSYFVRWQAEVFGELNELDIYVDDRIGASASHGKAPSSGWSVPADQNGWRVPKEFESTVVGGVAVPQAG